MLDGDPKSSWIHWIGSARATGRLAATGTGTGSECIQVCHNGTHWLAHLPTGHWALAEYVTQYVRLGGPRPLGSRPMAPPMAAAYALDGE